MKHEPRANRVVTQADLDAQAAFQPSHLPARLRITGQICEGQNLDEKRNVRVTIIRGGASINGYYYTTDVLQALASLLENAQAYVDHTSGPTRSVREVVGFYRDAAYVPAHAETPNGCVEATLHVLASADWLWSMIREACELGNPGLIGLSIDIYGTWQPLPDPPPGAHAKNKQVLKEVTGVLALNSCDVVTHPSAGGAFQHILHNLDDYPQTAFYLKGVSPMHDDYTSEFSPNELIPTQTSPEHVQEQLASHQEEAQETRKLLAELRLERAQLALERRLLECTLPERVKTRLRKRY
ncbi:MAG: hypothetical protein ACREHG_04060, partial [Candidatus Saccharimonadales bacterium]